MSRTRKPLELSPRAVREYHAELEYIAADDPHAAGLVFSRVERERIEPEGAQALADGLVAKVSQPGRWERGSGKGV